MPVRIVTALDGEVQDRRDRGFYLDIEPHGSRPPQEQSREAMYMSWPDAAPYVSCHDPQHYWDAFPFMQRRVARPTPIPEPGGAIILDPRFTEYPAQLRDEFRFDLPPSDVRRHCIAKIRHGYVRGNGSGKIVVLESHAGSHECGVTRALGWSLNEVMASHLRGVDFLLEQAPETERRILTFHYHWGCGERHTYRMNEEAWREELRSML